MPNCGIGSAPQGWNYVGGQEFPGAKGAGNDEFRTSNGELRPWREAILESL
jgi:hypothetical protein